MLDKIFKGDSPFDDEGKLELMAFPKELKYPICQKCQKLRKNFHQV